jgi:hypothetical protein
MESMAQRCREKQGARTARQSLDEIAKKERSSGFMRSVTVLRAALPSLFALSLLLACDEAPTPSPTAVAPAVPSPSVAPSPAPAPAPVPAPDKDLGDFGALVRALSEPAGEFFSDNLISNETSYLQVADALAARPEGGGYIGVGPEQNFTYIALTRPRYAFLVDIRRDNLLQHLWYRALFEEAEDRAHFVSLMLGRPRDATQPLPAQAGVDEVLARATKGPADAALLAGTLARVKTRIEGTFRVALGDKDKQALDRIARAFFDGGLALRFELKASSGRRYPSLGEVLAASAPDGHPRSFLASDEAFRFVQRMEREGRVVPLAGDFAGDGALPALAKRLREHDLRVSTFYVSNVEQYMLDPPVWKKWVRNVAALPQVDGAVFVRCYLDQGKKHPRQMDGHRTATVLARISEFVTREEVSPSRSFFKVATEGAL